MKIIYDWQIFQMQSYGGVSRYIIEIAKRLKYYNNIKIVSAIHKNHYLRESGIVKPIFFINSFKYSSFVLKLVTNIFFKISRKKYYCDIFHKTYYNNIKCIKAKKNVITVHDMIHELYPNLFGKFDITSKYKAKCIRNADHIICVSNTTKNDLLKIYNVDKDKISVIYSGITRLNSEFNKKNIKLDFQYILYVGQRKKYKNFNVLMECYKSNACLNDKFKIICFGGGEFDIEEVSTLVKYNLSDRVMYFSGDDAILKLLYQNAFVLVHTSLYEGFGFTPLEAIDNNCMVIASDTEISREILGDGVLYFDPYSSDDLNNKILLISSNSEILNNLKNKSILIKNKYSWEKTAIQTQLLYEKILNE